MKNEYYIGVDPGVHLSAYAILEKDYLLDCGFFETQIQSIQYWLKQKIPIFNTTLVIELPDKIHRNVCKKDILSLTRMTERIFTLGFLHGCITIYQPVRRWKGNLPKEVIQKRMEDIYGKLSTKFSILKSQQHHIYDAIGIADYTKKRNNNQ